MDTRVKMLCAVVGLICFLAGMAVGAICRAKAQADMMIRTSAAYKELVLRGDAAIAMLQKVQNGLDDIQSKNDRKRVVLAGDLKDIRNIAGMGIARVEPEKKIVGG
jgi:hypothetical protein